MSHPSESVSTATAREAAHEVVDREPALCREHVVTRLADDGVDREQARRALQSLLASGDIEIDDGVTVTG